MTINCPECGKELPDGTRFCTNCGQPCNRQARRAQQRENMDVSMTVPAQPFGGAGASQGFSQQPTIQMPASQTARPVGGTPGFSSESMSSQSYGSSGGESFVPAYAPQAAQQASAAAAASGNSPQQAKGKRTALIAVALAIVLIAVVVAAAAWTSRSSQEAAYEAQHAERYVTFSIDAPDYQDGADSPIPVRISGTDLDGVQVDQVYYVTPKQPTIGLRQGSYTASIAASPLLSCGTLYEVPGSLIDLQVRDQDLSGGDIRWAFTEKEPIDITDDELDAAYQMAVQSGMAAEEAESLRSGIVGKRQAAQDAKTASDQAAAAQSVAQAEQNAADAAAAGARNFDDGYVALDVPDFWQGYYTYDTYGHTSGAFHTEFYIPGSDFMLLRIDGMDGDLGSYSASYMNAATEIWDSANGQGRYSDSDLDLALYLQTGGAITRDDVLSCRDGYEAEALGEDYIGYFMDNNIAPTVTTSSL